MKPFSKPLVAILALGAVTCPAVAVAHQPRIPEGTRIIVPDPEVSKAYYSQLTGAPHVYRLSSDTPFDLYVNVLVPAIPGQKKDVSAVIRKDGSAEPLATLIGNSFAWKPFFEPFGHDAYWMGPEYHATAAAGQYEITVSSPTNDSKYSLAIGETEAFGLTETANAIALIPKIKRGFFEESPITFILSPFGWGYALLMDVMAFAAGFVYHLSLRTFARSPSRRRPKNIGAGDRWLRAILGLALLVWAIATTWNPLLLFLSGLCFFESIFSWCGLYAAMGKNTCSIE